MITMKLKSHKQSRSQSAALLAAFLLVGGACGMRATAAGEDKPSVPAEAAKVAGTQLAIVRGETVTEDTLTSYEQLLETTERRFPGDRADTLADYVLQTCIGDVYTTLPLEEGEQAAIPTTYKVATERYMLRRILSDQVMSSIKPTEAQMEDWYTRNRAAFEQPEKISARHLFVGISKDNPSSSPERARKRIEEAKSQADKGTSFALLAIKYSEAPTGANGGDIGWLSYRMPFGPENKPINPILDNALFKLKPGQVSEILQTTHGLHLLYAEQRVTTRPQASRTWSRVGFCRAVCRTTWGRQRSAR